MDDSADFNRGQADIEGYYTQKINDLEELNSDLSLQLKGELAKVKNLETAKVDVDRNFKRVSTRLADVEKELSDINKKHLAKDSETVERDQRNRAEIKETRQLILENEKLLEEVIIILYLYIYIRSIFNIFVN